MTRAESAHNCEDLDGDFEPTKRKNLLRRNRAVKSHTRKKTRVFGSAIQNQSMRKGENVNYDASIFDDLDSGDGVQVDTNSYHVSCQETEIVRPGPLKLRRKGRRILYHIEPKMDKQRGNKYKESGPAVMDDTTVLYDVENSCVEGQEAEPVPCPICMKMFPTKDIEEHASECNEYCEEESQPDDLHIPSCSSSSQVVRWNSEGSISENKWTEFDNEKTFEDEHTSTIQTQQQ